MRFSFAAAVLALVSTAVADTGYNLEKAELQMNIAKAASDALTKQPNNKNIKPVSFRTFNVT
jgi:hypothetical protein